MNQQEVSSQPISRETGEQYTWGEVCDGWHLLKMQDMSVIEEVVPPGAGEIKHFHNQARQFFYVLEGVATIEFEQSEVTFTAGQGIHVPPGATHRLCNQSATAVRFLVFSSPTTQGDRTNAVQIER
jgi:mannose-6-phosphate isomerase-like protein (cupin superfamily)